MDVRIARSARKHRLSAGRLREALRDAELVRHDGDAALYVGVDARGLAIELVVVPDDRRAGGFTVIHAMPQEWRKR